MNCIESLALLSDYQDGLLNDDVRHEVHIHLIVCEPCRFISYDLDSIVKAALVMREHFEAINFPDENIVWQRLSIKSRAV